jgi:integrase/recombinase XerD
MEADVMREKLKNDLMMLLDKHVDVENLRKLEPQIELLLSDYEIEARKTEVIPYGSDIPETVEVYIVSKKISGLSDKTLYLYHAVLADFFRTVQKKPEQVMANDIRVYLYLYQKNHGISNRTLDSRRTILCGYFNWMAAEEYICRNPAINIPPIKYERKHKRAMTQMDLEKVRLSCETKRERAVIEMLYSTGCRVTELERLNISDINFETKEVTLFGKGDKHRVSYLNAKAEVALRDYLGERTDGNPALFVYDRKPYSRLKKSGIEFLIRKLMQRTSGVTTHVTPHVFRHTTATTALDRGMNIVDVSRLLGHAKIETTMEYITTNSNSVKSNHQNYVI